MPQSCDYLSFQQRSLFQQGYQRYTPAELKQLEWGLRFTPAVCSAIALYGLVTQNPVLLFAVAALGVLAFFFPGGHPMDLLYNYGVRPLFGTIKLPANPFQRRLACLAAGVMNIAAGALLLMKLPLAAYAVGGVLLVLQAVVIFTHFCTLSWVYEGIMRLFGKWATPVETNLATQFLKSGANLIDVRSPQEFAQGSLKGAINLPLEEIDEHREKLKQGVNLLFCRSGTRSHIAAEKLKSEGLTNVYNLGAFGRAQQITAQA
jgi:rhodanese-related sulfurtransferase